MKIIKMFLSIQGEGINTGLPTFFIRVSGCNLRCTYCDTKYSYEGGKEMNIDEIITEVEKNCSDFKLVCITGGEPLLNKETKKLMKSLMKRGYKIDVETNGSVLIIDFPNSSSVLYSVDVKCPSSGMSDKMKFKNLDFLKKKDQVKFIIGDHDDFTYARKITEKYVLIKKTNVIFSPVGGVDADSLVRWILKEKLNVRVGLQMHKIIWNSDKTELNLVS